MHIQIMAETDCLAFIRGERTGRLACCRNDRPYVVPIHYVCAGSSIVSFSMPGQKMDFMRSNPNICFEVETIERRDKWKCAIVTGTFREFISPEDKQEAWGLLQEHNDWWEIGSQPVRDDQAKADRTPHFFSISIDMITGRQAV
jgi:uncharacterized protein